MKNQKNADNKMSEPTIPQSATILTASVKTKNKASKAAADKNEEFNASTQRSV